jgi:hypothetical protein
MTPDRRRAAIAALVGTLLLVAPRAFVRPSSAADDAPAKTRIVAPIRESIDRVVVRVLAEEKTPCRKADEDGIPCFPVTIETAGTVGPTVSVRDSLREIGSDKRPSPNRPPTVAESVRYRPGPASAVGSVGFDPGCAGKAALKWLKGQNDTYYLYGVRDRGVERVLMYDHPAEPSSFQGEVELLGRIEGECEALAAYRHAERETAAMPAPPASDPK